jgi:hypothetical protein
MSIEQKINLLAIELLEMYGNMRPTQKQIDKAEHFIMRNQKPQKKVNSTYLHQELDLSSKMV